MLGVLCYSNKKKILFCYVTRQVTPGTGTGSRFRLCRKNTMYSIEMVNLLRTGTYVVGAKLDDFVGLDVILTATYEPTVLCKILYCDLFI